MDLKNKYVLKSVKVAKEILFYMSCMVILLFLTIFGTYAFASIAGPPPIEVPETTVYYGADGKVIGESNTVQRRYWMSLEDIPEELIQATIAIEDQHFYKHLGFDVKRIGGAILADIKARAKVQGASTITQQYARNLFLSHEKTWKRKLKEAIYTIRLEANYTKEEILEGYLNTIYYGHGTYGVEAASRYYFNKSAKDLSLSEAAMLAAVPKGPSSFSPFASFEKAKKRQELILSEMVKQNFITTAEAEQMKNENLQLVGELNTFTNPSAPYFKDVIQTQLKKIVGLDERTIELGGLRVFTTFDPNLQSVAEEVFKGTLPEESTIQGALVAMDPMTGYVKALIGGRNYQESSYNRAVSAIRHPGSTMKPILYYAALEKGFTPATAFRSERTTFTFDDGRAEYTPQNFNHRYANDEITLAKAVALSDNVYAVKTHLFLGMDVLPEYAKRIGIHSPMNPVPSLALGTSGVSVLEMATAYSHFANGGKSVEPVFITKVMDRTGKVLYEHEFESEQVLDEDLTFVMNHMLTGIFDDVFNSYATVTGQTIIPKITHQYAGKSGSTEKDSWFIGYTPNLLAAVWTGYDKNQKLTLPQERAYPKIIWADFMEKGLKDQPVTVFKPTENVIGVHVHPDSGLLATEDCPVSRYMYFVKGTEPVEYCSDDLGEELDEDESNKKPSEKPWYRKLFDLFS